MDEPLNVQVGDEVIVFESSRRYTARMTFENGHPATVTEVRRKYFSVEVVNAYSYLSDDYRLDTGAGRHGHAMTREAIERTKRRYAAEDVIKAHGLEFKNFVSDRFTLEQLEALAELLKSFDEEDK